MQWLVSPQEGQQDSEEKWSDQKEECNTVEPRCILRETPLLVELQRVRWEIQNLPRRIAALVLSGKMGDQRGPKPHAAANQTTLLSFGYLKRKRRDDDPQPAPLPERHSPAFQQAVLLQALASAAASSEAMPTSGGRLSLGHLWSSSSRKRGDSKKCSS